MTRELYVIIKGSMFFKQDQKERTRRVEEAGVFSYPEAEAFVDGKKGDGVTHQKLAFYKDFLVDERKMINEKLNLLEVKL